MFAVCQGSIIYFRIHLRKANLLFARAKCFSWLFTYECVSVHTWRKGTSGFGRYQWFPKGWTIPCPGDTAVLCLSSTWCHAGCPSFAGIAVGRPCHAQGFCQGSLPVSQPARLPPGRVQFRPSWWNNCILNGPIAFQQHSRSCLLCVCFTAVWISLTLELTLRFIFTQQAVLILPEESRTSPATAVHSLNQSVLTLAELQRSQAALQVS